MASKRWVFEADCVPRPVIGTTTSRYSSQKPRYMFSLEGICVFLPSRIFLSLSVLRNRRLIPFPAIMSNISSPSTHCSSPNLFRKPTKKNPNAMSLTKSNNLSKKSRISNLGFTLWQIKDAPYFYSHEVEKLGNEAIWLVLF